VSKVEWVNPHIFIYFDAKDESGKVTTWRLQSAPPMFFKGSGLTKDKLLDGTEAASFGMAIMLAPVNLFGQFPAYGPATASYVTEAAKYPDAASKPTPH